MFNALKMGAGLVAGVALEIKAKAEKELKDVNEFRLLLKETGLPEAILDLRIGFQTVNIDELNSNLLSDSVESLEYCQRMLNESTGWYNSLISGKKYLSADNTLLPSVESTILKINTRFLEPLNNVIITKKIQTGQDTAPLDNASWFEPADPFLNLRNTLITLKNPSTRRELPLAKFAEISGRFAKSTKNPLEVVTPNYINYLLSNELIARANEQLLPLEINFDDTKKAITVTVNSQDSKDINLFIKSLANQESGIIDLQTNQNRTLVIYQAMNSKALAGQFNQSISTAGLEVHNGIIDKYRSRLNEFNNLIDNVNAWNTELTIEKTSKLIDNFSDDLNQLQVLKDNLGINDQRITITKQLISFIHLQIIALKQSLLERSVALHKSEPVIAADDQQFFETLMTLNNLQQRKQVAIEDFPKILRKYQNHGFGNSAAKAFIRLMHFELIECVKNGTIQIETEINTNPQGELVSVHSVNCTLAQNTKAKAINEFFALVDSIHPTQSAQYRTGFNSQVTVRGNADLCKKLQDETIELQTRSSALSDKVQKFKKIYSALYLAQKSIFKSSFSIELDRAQVRFNKSWIQCSQTVPAELKQSYQQKNDAKADLDYYEKSVTAIEQYIALHAKGRSALAWQLTNANLSHEGLVSAIHKASFERSNIFKMSHAFGQTIFSARSLNKFSDVRSLDEINQAKPGTRTHKIVTALR